MSSKNAAQVEQLNTQTNSVIDRAALDSVLAEQGMEFANALTEAHRHLFSSAVVLVTAEHVAQMRAVIAAVEEVVGLPMPQAALGVFYGYDFHLNAQGAHLIEVNTNAGGAFLNAVLVESQRDAALRGTVVAQDELESAFIEMFRSEWRLARGEMPLKTIAIMDERPEAQYLFPEFLLVQQMFERAGITAFIVAPEQLQVREDDLYCNGQRVDLIYNRLTDFDLNEYLHIRTAWEMNQVVVTPNPSHYQRYADKRKLEIFSNDDKLRASGVSEAAIAALLAGVPQTKRVRAEDAEQWWAERKQWFFKPASGYGSKGAYRGDKLTKRVFEEIMQSDYVAQRPAPPGERRVSVEGVEQSFKYDVRCYVYAGHIQLVAARLYQGQTTNFRTPGGGFALVRQID